MNHTELLYNLDKLHTTEMGVKRIRRNLEIKDSDVVLWCQNKIKEPTCQITRKGKNWYAEIDRVKITVNAYSYTIITAHKTSIKNSQD